MKNFTTVYELTVNRGTLCTYSRAGWFYSLNDFCENEDDVRQEVGGEVAMQMGACDYTNTRTYNLPRSPPPDINHSV